MKEYEKFMKLFNDKGYVKSMELAINLSPMDMLPDELKPHVIKGSVANAISLTLTSDPEFKEAFDRASCELMLEKIVKDLDLKKDENFKPVSDEIFAQSIAHILFKNKSRK